MELTIVMRLRIAAAIGLGVVLIGILCWPLVAPEDPQGALSLVDGSMSVAGAMVLVLVAFVTGIVGYFVSWPYGREIGILAVPGGLALWGLRGGSVADLLATHADITGRMGVYYALRWESAFWLALVAMGFAGVCICELIFQPQRKPVRRKEKSTGQAPTPPDIYIRLFGIFLGPMVREIVADFREKRRQARSDRGTDKSNVYINSAIAVVGSVAIVIFGIRLFARDVAMGDSLLGQVVCQPAVAQVAFAVTLSFGIAGFAVKKLLNAGYIWPAVSSGLVTTLAVMLYVKTDTMEHLVRNWPVLFFSNSILSVLPIQMVAFGCLGAIWGYWIAMQYSHWRQHG